MKAVSAVLFSLAASAMAMPPPQRLERREVLNDDDWSRLWEGDCSQRVQNAREDCIKKEDSKLDCDEAGRKEGTKCIINESRGKLTDDARHKNCSAPAVQGVEDCMNAKDNTKTVPQCQRAQVETYLQCTLPGGQGNPATAQDPEYGDIWRKTCSALSTKAREECLKIQDADNKRENKRIDNDMKCLLDNTKARAESDSVHNACSASAIAAVNDCFLTNNTAGKTLPMCQREQWDAYPGCVLNKMAP
ncbi:hypothetical protein MGU_06162 [Metarhizium guizhouense ARSEF 977]|uniref:Uncharacterized protein n=1 Tax=Metarhizium guizhouense (strain ARSEF 977) TaxID=1276136 RepID=A0A0B4GI10_METGA|nr:hypothetical protein MGU_06162 [Metarhizium guizhouense ARSEF 977]